MEKNEFKISVNGLATGENTILSRADKEFFASFENYEVLEADLRVTFIADKHPSRVDIECNIEGTITVPCDRCLSPVAIPVNTSNSLALRLRESDAPLGDLVEEVFLSDGDTLDLGQEVYDFSLLALPLQRFHKEGDCDEAALAYLSKEDDVAAAPELSQSPFSGLAEMMKNKK